MSNNFKTFLGLLFILTSFWYATTALTKNLGPQEMVRHIDVRFAYISGLCWLNGKSPYQAEQFIQVWNEQMANESFYSHLQVGNVAFSYPPTMGIIAIPLALFSWDTAKSLVDGLNVVALLLMALFTMLLFKTLQPSFLILSFGIGLSLIFQKEYTTAILVVGQNSLLATAGCLGAMYFTQRQHWFLAALFILLASIKPHLSLLIITYLFITSHSWRLLGWSTLVVSLTSLIVLALGKDYSPVPEFLNSMSYYKALYVNTTELLPGLHFLLGALAVSPMFINLLPVFGIIIVVSLAFWFRQLPRSSTHTLLTLSLVCCLTALFMPIHHYDYTIFFLVTTVWIILGISSILLLLPGILLIAFPGATPLLSWLTHQTITPIMVGTIASLYLTAALAGINWSQRRLV